MTSSLWGFLQPHRTELSPLPVNSHSKLYLDGGLLFSSCCLLIWVSPPQYELSEDKAKIFIYPCISCIVTKSVFGQYLVIFNIWSYLAILKTILWTSTLCRFIACSHRRDISVYIINIRRRHRKDWGSLISTPQAATRVPSKWGLISYCWKFRMHPFLEIMAQEKLVYYLTKNFTKP